MSTVIAERPHGRSPIWHLPRGKSEDDWQDIWCGGGIVLPGPRERVAISDVCPACRQARKEAQR